MSAEDRSLWLAQAWAEVADIPAKAFFMACAAARREVEHPARLIPAIIRHSEVLEGQIRRRYAHELRGYENRNAPRLELNPAAAIAERIEVGAMVSELVRKMKWKAFNHG